MIITVESHGLVKVIKNRFENLFDSAHKVLRSPVVVLHLSKNTSSLELLVKLAKYIIIAELRRRAVGAVDLGIVLISVIEFAPYLDNLLTQIFSLFQQ